MKIYFWGIILVLLFASCSGSKKDLPASEIKAQTDSLVTRADSLSKIDEPLPPKTADEFFNDFIYGFMTNRKFQLQRIKFPLQKVVNGAVSFMEKPAWHFDRIYSHQETYTVIYDRLSSIKIEKDTSVKQAIVEWIYLNKKQVKQYIFNRINGEWFLTSLNYHAMSKNVNADFLLFYQRFAVDSAFQRNHITNPVSFKTYDSDNFQTIDGVVDVDQWFAFKPMLPHGVITNINYGQSYNSSNTRIMVINGLSNSMYSVLTFKKKGGRWFLTKFEN